MPQLYWIIPLEGGHPDNSLPGGRPGHISGQPIPPGGPTDPGYGRPGWSPADPGYGHGGGAHPDQGLPGGGHISGGPIYPGGHPGNRPPGSGNYPSGQPVPPDEINPPLPEELSPPYDDKVIVAIKRPGVAEWKVTAYETDAYPDQGLPPTSEPK